MRTIEFEPRDRGRRRVFLDYSKRHLGENCFSLETEDAVDRLPRPLRGGGGGAAGGGGGRGGTIVGMV